MKRCVKYSLYAAILLMFTVFLSGCHAMYPIHFEFDGNYMADKTIDILIPIDENDENYRESTIRYFDILVKYGQLHSKYNDETVTEELKQTEIERYNENGYRSMLCHFPTQDFSRSSIDDNKIRMSIYLDSKNEYIRLCDKYKSFRLAVIGSRGEILSISEEIPFKSSKEYYLDNNVAYDPVKNAISPEYQRHGKFRFWLLIIEIIMYAMPVMAIELLVVVIIFKKAKYLEFPYSIIESAVMTLPLTAFLAVRYDDAIKSTLTLNAAFDRFFDLSDTSVWVVLYAFIPYISFLAITILTCIRKAIKSEDNTEAGNENIY